MKDDVANRVEFTDSFDGEVSFRKAFVMRRDGNTGEVGDVDNDRGVVVTNVLHLVVHHSPDGFEFGYSGAADLALNACQFYLNITQYTGRKTKCYDGNCWALAWRLHQAFKREFIERVNWRKGTSISFAKLEVWFFKNITGELLRECMIEEIEEME